MTCKVTSRFLLCLSLCFASTGRAQETDSFCYFPLAIGNTWSFTYVDFPGVFTYSITDTLVRGDKVYYFWDSPLRFNYIRYDSAGHIYQYFPEDDVEVLLFDFTAEAPDTVHVETEGREEEAFDVILTGRTLNVRAASQTIRNCLRFILDWFPGFVDDEQEVWLAPNIGPVVIYQAFDTPAYLDSARIIAGCGESRVVSVNQPESIPEDAFPLFQNYPNPFNPETTIEYELGQAGRVLLTIYNIRGQSVRTLVDKWQLAGPHQIAWDGTSDHPGVAAPSGVYFYELKHEGLVIRRKMALIR